MKTNIIMLADSYKYGHFLQYPKNMVYMYNYMEARKETDEIYITGLQYYLKEYLTKPITIKMVEEAKDFAQKHGITFNYKGWKYIVKELNGKIPVRIKAIPEGYKAKSGIPLIVIESTDKNVPWIVGWLETLLMKIWYPSTITTKSKKIYDMLIKYGNKDWVKFALHNFGDRSMTSVEAAAISGFAHNCIFLGTDNFHSLKFCKDYYNTDISAFSVFATEHSTTTINAFYEDEIKFVERMLIENPNNPIMSFVADSFDVYNFTDKVSNPKENIRKILEKNKQKLVIRPDSGNPINVLDKMFEIMEKNKVFDIQINGKKASSKYGILWGDGINEIVIKDILEYFTKKGYAAENFIFGCGTQLGQTGIDRDTYSFAIKYSYIEIKEKNKKIGIEVFKNPITSKNKQSKKGKIISVIDKKTNELICIKEQNFNKNFHKRIMEIIYENGNIVKDITLEDIRKNIFN